MSNKRIIRVIIYEGEEEVVDLYEEKALKGTRKGGIPENWIVNWVDSPEQKIKQKQKHFRLSKNGIKISARTLDRILVGENHNLNSIYDKFEQFILDHIHTKV